MPNSLRQREPAAAQAKDLLAACQAGALRAGWSLSRALGISIRLAPQEVVQLSTWRQRATTPASFWTSPGLIVLMPVAQQAAVFVIDTTTRGLPSWLVRPDGLERGRLAAAAQELGTSLLPRHFGARDCAAGSVNQIGAALTRGGCSGNAICVPTSLLLSSGAVARAALIWPLDRPASVLDVESAAAAASCGSPANLTARDAGEMQQAILRVSVVLAKKREAVNHVVRLAPGDVLRFEKSHRSPLELQVDGRRVAAGQCVEIGHRLGLVITSP